ncbi:MAG: AAA-like domain-containing protein [Cyanobacteriota bacterium]|nr:AAA-like domain-containing protein [Cyanobacteriota bacterium]
MNRIEFVIAFDRLQRSPKRKRVLLELLKGETDAAIAKSLKIETGTVRKQISTICQTFGLSAKRGRRRSKRSDLIALFAEHRPDLIGKSKGSAAKTSCASDRYVERPPIESQCDRVISQPHAFLNIQGFSQIGKTWLLNRILDRAAQRGYRTVRLNFLMVDREILTNFDRFLRWFCASIGKLLLGEHQVEKYWDPCLGSNASCTAYFEEYLLDKTGTPLVLGLDNVERLFAYPEIAGDFFNLLRAWHEEDKRGDRTEQLRLAISHSYDDYPPPSDALNLPFSIEIGTIVKLPEFDRQQVRELVRRNQFDWSDTQIDRLMATLGGHPGLLQFTLSTLAASSDLTLDRLLQTAIGDGGLYANHLWKYWLVLREDPELIRAMDAVVKASEPIQLPFDLAHHLARLGLVRWQGNAVEPRCELYRQYFQDRT